MIKLKVENDRITTDGGLILSGGVLDRTISFSFSSEWDGYSVNAVFIGSGNTVNMPAITADTEYFIPWECISEPGTLTVTLYGIKGDEVKPVIFTVLPVSDSGLAYGDAPGDPEQGVYESIVEQLANNNALMSDVQAKLETAETSASNSADIASQAKTDIYSIISEMSSKPPFVWVDLEISTKLEGWAKTCKVGNVVYIKAQLIRVDKTVNDTIQRMKLFTLPDGYYNASASTLDPDYISLYYSAVLSSTECTTSYPAYTFIKSDTGETGVNIEKAFLEDCVLDRVDIDARMILDENGSYDGVDTAMSDTSENAVQNKVIKAYVDEGLAEKSDTTHNHDEVYIKEHQDISGKEDVANKVTEISSDPTDAEYPSAKAVKTYVDSKDEQWELINTITISDDQTTAVTINRDSNNAAYKYKELRLLCFAATVTGAGISISVYDHNNTIIDTNGIDISAMPTELDETGSAKLECRTEGGIFEQEVKMRTTSSTTKPALSYSCKEEDVEYMIKLYLATSGYNDNHFLNGSVFKLYGRGKVE